MEDKSTKMSTGGARSASIIVPVYKVEPYLRCCVDSILAQTFTDFELILVDDGSPDNCGTICDEYAAEDDRVVVIHQENQGVSAARNAGIDWVFANSTSEWITFVDSDDTVLPSYLETLYRYATEQNADVATVNGYTFCEDSELVKRDVPAVLSQVMNGRQACISFYRGEGVIAPQPWGKLCSRTLFEKLRFQIGITYAEDEDVVVRLMYKAMKVVIVNANMYGYRQRVDSAVWRKFSMWAYDRLRIIDSCINFFEKENEAEIVALAKKRRTKFCAKNMLLAYGAKMVDVVPEEYKMPLWKAIFITLRETIRNGGTKHIWVRIRQFVKRI